MLWRLRSQRVIIIIIIIIIFSFGYGRNWKSGFGRFLSESLFDDIWVFQRIPRWRTTDKTRRANVPYLAGSAAQPGAVVDQTAISTNF